MVALRGAQCRSDATRRIDTTTCGGEPHDTRHINRAIAEGNITCRATRRHGQVRHVKISAQRCQNVTARVRARSQINTRARKLAKDIQIASGRDRHLPLTIQLTPKINRFNTVQHDVASDIGQRCNVRIQRTIGRDRQRTTNIHTRAVGRYICRWINTLLRFAQTEISRRIDGQVTVRINVTRNPRIAARHDRDITANDGILAEGAKRRGCAYVRSLRARLSQRLGDRLIAVKRLLGGIHNLGLHVVSAELGAVIKFRRFVRHPLEFEAKARLHDVRLGRRPIIVVIYKVFVMGIAAPVVASFIDRAQLMVPCYVIPLPVIILHNGVFEARVVRFAWVPRAITRVIPRIRNRIWCK